MLERAGLLHRTVQSRRHLCRLEPAPLAAAADHLRFYERCPAAGTRSLCRLRCGWLLAERGDVLYVRRHLPLRDVHAAAEAVEAAAEQGAFWEMHDRLLDRQDELRPADLVRHAAALGLDVDRFRARIALT